jgi:hypothetical protein
VKHSSLAKIILIVDDIEYKVRKVVPFSFFRKERRRTAHPYIKVERKRGGGWGQRGPRYKALLMEARSRHTQNYP